MVVVIGLLGGGGDWDAVYCEEEQETKELEGLKEESEDEYDLAGDDDGGVGGLACKDKKVEGQKLGSDDAVTVMHEGATCGVTVSTAALLACHQCYCAGSSLAWGMNLRL